MPRLRDNTHPMTRLLLGYNINGANLSAVLGCAPDTARKKIRDPARLTIRDLQIIHFKFGVPVEEIRGRLFG